MLILDIYLSIFSNKTSLAYTLEIEFSVSRALFSKNKGIDLTIQWIIRCVRCK
jgi:hypothetical protein